MSTISATELDLLTFFEAEPTFLDPNDPWPYTDAAYSVIRGDLQLSFSVAPAHKDVRIILKREAETLYELNAMGVLDVKYHNDNGRETLETAFANGGSLFLKLKPAISLSHVSSECT